MSVDHPNNSQLVSDIMSALDARPEFGGVFPDTRERITRQLKLLVASPSMVIHYADELAEEFSIINTKVADEVASIGQLNLSDTYATITSKLPVALKTARENIAKSTAKWSKKIPTVGELIEAVSIDKQRTDIITKCQEHADRSALAVTQFNQFTRSLESVSQTLGAHIVGLEVAADVLKATQKFTDDELRPIATKLASLVSLFDTITVSRSLVAKHVVAFTNLRENIILPVASSWSEVQVEGRDHMVFLLSRHLQGDQADDDSPRRTAQVVRIALQFIVFITIVGGLGYMAFLALAWLFAPAPPAPPVEVGKVYTGAWSDDGRVNKSYVAEVTAIKPSAEMKYELKIIYPSDSKWVDTRIAVRNNGCTVELTADNKIKAQLDPELSVHNSRVCFQIKEPAELDPAAIAEAKALAKRRAGVQ